MIFNTFQVDGYETRRKKMVARLEQMGICHPLVLDAMLNTPRHLFIEEALRSRSYDNLSLPIGLGQTISQPYIVARMTELLLAGRKQPLNKALEIGTGCGYQTAILQKVGIEHVYSIERLSSLRELAKRNLRVANLHRPRLICADGYLGLPKSAPFDVIIVTAAPKEVPVELLKQLDINGRMVLPLEKNGVQHLWVIDKYINGYQETCVQEVNFVLLLNGQK
ncbi:MAG: protein-L-isoaspartate(D-aspartate) O-methyltransferase [Neisseriaceae bacterium]|nr:MAG: protein-L-isoaspartate(D-aspartate) O-methyltransferase [Neisseriaceae bacterium]